MLGSYGKKETKKSQRLIGYEEITMIDEIKAGKVVYYITREYVFHGLFKYVVNEARIVGVFTILHGKATITQAACVHKDNYSKIDDIIEQSDDEKRIAMISDWCHFFEKSQLYSTEQEAREAIKEKNLKEKPDMTYREKLIELLQKNDEVADKQIYDEYFCGESFFHRWFFGYTSTRDAISEILNMEYVAKEE